RSKAASRCRTVCACWCATAPAVHGSDGGSAPGGDRDVLLQRAFRRLERLDRAVKADWVADRGRLDIAFPHAGGAEGGFDFAGQRFGEAIGINRMQVAPA